MSDELPLVRGLLLIWGIGRDRERTLELGEGELTVEFHASPNDGASVQLHASARLDGVNPQRLQSPPLSRRLLSTRGAALNGV